MKKNVHILLSFLLLTGAARGQSYRVDEFHGADAHPSSSEWYANGKLARRVLRDEQSGKILQSTIYAYSDTALVSSTDYSHQGNDSTLQSESFYKNGLRTELRFTKAGIPFSLYRTFNAKKELVSEELIGREHGPVVYRINFQHLADGLTILRFEPNEKLLSDKMKEWPGPFSVPYDSIIKTFDAKGRVTRERAIASRRSVAWGNADVMTLPREYVYSYKGKQTRPSSVKAKNGKAVESETRTCYDKQGRPVSQETKRKNESSSLRFYYDAQGRLERKEVKVNGKKMPPVRYVYTAL